MSPSDVPRQIVNTLSFQDQHRFQGGCAPVRTADHIQARSVSLAQIILSIDTCIPACCSVLLVGRPMCGQDENSLLKNASKVRLEVSPAQLSFNSQYFSSDSPLRPSVKFRTEVLASPLRVKNFRCVDGPILGGCLLS